MATANAIRSVYDDRFADLNLNLSLASLLAYVAEFGPVNQTRAAEHLGQGRAVTGTQIDRLEADGLVQRCPDPADRRVWLLAITEAGRHLVQEVLAIDTDVRAELRSGISRAERQALNALLVRLQHNLAAADRAGGITTTPTNSNSNEQGATP